MKASPFVPLPSKRIFEQVADQVRHLISSGVFRPGDKLPSERELAAQFNIGRSALREALRVLEHEGLIVIKQGSDGGSFIRRPHISDDTKTVIELFQIGELDLQRITEARLALELRVMDFVVQRITEEELALLEKIINDAEASLKRGDLPPVSAIIDFHVIITKASKNPALEMLVGSLINLVVNVLGKVPLKQDLLVQHLDQHKQILEGLRERNLEKTKKNLETHILTIGRNLENSMKNRRPALRK